jgi:(p)ppGpp synthase/HD superfamily hydrolase
MDLILKALTFAKIAHEGQKRDNGDPYIVHPARVMARTLLLPGATEHQGAAAALHDVLEDTKVKPDEIEKEFGPVVLKYVNELTNVSTGSNKSREERKAMDRAHLNGVSKEAKRIKMLDRIDNLSLPEIIMRDRKFVELYTRESWLLLKVIGNADEALQLELGRTVAKAEALFDIYRA